MGTVKKVSSILSSTRNPSNGGTQSGGALSAEDKAWIDGYFEGYKSGKKHYYNNRKYKNAK